MEVQVPAQFPQDEWAFGQEFLFNQDAQAMLFWARTPVVLMSLSLAWVVMTWAGKLWGLGAGLLALFLYALDPTITAHAQLVTTDVGLAFFSTLYLFQLRSCLKDPSWKRWSVAGVLLGLALGVKFSALILLPITLVLMALASLQAARAAVVKTSSESGASSRPRYTIWKEEITVRSLTFVLLLAIAFLVLWMLYFLSTDPSIYWKGLRAVNEDHKNFHPYLLSWARLGKTVGRVIF
jgi:predicted membrane-bound dolichyl-phosphate-mannose-protein mannosyltransferase